MKIQQNFVVRRQACILRQQYRRSLNQILVSIGVAMSHKVLGGHQPEHAVQRLERVRRRCDDQAGSAALHLAREPAGIRQLVGRVEVKGHLGHGTVRLTCCQRAAWRQACGQCP